MGKEIRTVEKMLGIEIHAPGAWKKGARAYCGSKKGVVIYSKAEMSFVTCETCILIHKKINERRTRDLATLGGGMKVIVGSHKDG